MTGENSYTLKISGEAGLRNVQDIAAQLRQALAGHRTITVATDELTFIDITILQLLVATRKSALAAGKTVSLRAAPGGALHKLLLQTGFIGADGTARTPEGDFWTSTSATEQPA
ncbi:MAG TPA: STAS domain-containing protein [Devosia sp.]|nr:STAS domain-containing protein [Devosia sp.]